MKDLGLEMPVFYSENYQMENLYHALYYSYVDANDGHFLNRIDPWVCNITDKELKEHTVELARDAAKIEGVSVKELFEKYDFSIVKADDAIKTVLATAA